MKIKMWTKLLGEYTGTEIVRGDMISRPLNEWSCIDSNSQYYKVIYRAEDNSSAHNILECWKNENSLYNS